MIAYNKEDSNLSSPPSGGGQGAILENYITGKWIRGDGEGQALHDAVTGETIAYATTKGLDFASILQYGREVGNSSLRKFSFHERGRMLKALAMHLMERKEKFYEVS